MQPLSRRLWLLNNSDFLAWLTIFLWSFGHLKFKPLGDKCSLFFHWFKLKCSLIDKLVLSSRPITLLILPSSFFAGFINLACGLLAKLSLWSFKIRKQIFFLISSTRLRIPLFLKMILSSILILSLILLFAFFICCCDCVVQKPIIISWVQDNA